MMPRGPAVALWPILVVLLATGECAADAINIVRIELTETEPGRYILDSDLPPMLSVRAPRFDVPTRFTWEQLPEVVRVQDRPRMRATFTCTDQPLTPDDELFAPWPLDGAFVVARWHDGTVRTGYMPGDRTTGIVIDLAGLRSVTPTTRELVVDYVKAGLQHALTMPVHLVLVIAVALYARRRVTLRLLLAFTAGQAFSLVLIDVTGAGLPALPVEACLAVAAVMLARSGLRSNQAANATSYMAILFLLGLLHGMTVADQLRAADLRGMAGLQALFAFNLGVDAFQYALWLACLALLAISEGRPFLPRVRAAALFGAGASAVVLVAAPFLAGQAPGGTDRAVLPLDQLGGRSSGQQARTPVVQSTRQGLQYPCMSFIAIEPFEVRHEVLLRFDAIAPIIDPQAAVTEWVEVDRQPAVLRGALDEIARRCAVRIDGADGVPVVQHAAFAEVTAKGTVLRAEPVREKRDAAAVAITLAYRTDGLPSDMTVEWSLFSDEVSAVPLTSTDPINVERARLTPDAPSYEWINKLHGYPLPEVNAVALTRPRLPILSVLLIGAAVAVAAWRVWRRRQAVISPAVLALLVLAVTSYPFVRPAMAIPLLGQTRPSPGQATQVLEQLLTNIYRAFDHREEEAVFDRLALTVSGDALTDVYLENRRMLELENRGGARVRVTDVAIDGVDLVTATSAGSFVINAAWSVSGSVTHFGHTHFRTNAYRADVTIAADGNVWKLIGIEVLDEQRTR